MLHENFCIRNNIVCPDCKSVFKKNSPEWQAHWHCPHDSAHGNTPQAREKHNFVFHTSHSCSACGREYGNLPELARHRTSTCPGKIILCQFCQLAVPQEGDPDNPSAEELLSGLTAHELADGARTTECHLCQKIVRLRDMATHLKHHDLQKADKPLPRICRNALCGRTVDKSSGNGEEGTDLGLCGICFGPLYVAMYDPEGKAMKRRVERRYLSQMITGCGKSWCANEHCKTGRVNLGVAKPEDKMSAKDALPLIKPLMDGLGKGEPLHFCVDEAGQRRRKTAAMMAEEGTYELEWWVKALEAENGEIDAARTWLGNWAPQRKR
jgi:hypothetical protein